MADIIVGALVFLTVLAAVRHIYKNKKSGCCAGCSGCSGKIKDRRR